MVHLGLGLARCGTSARARILGKERLLCYVTSHHDAATPMADEAATPMADEAGRHFFVTLVTYNTPI